MRGKKFLKNAGELGKEGYAHPIASQKGVMSRDYNDVKRADALLVYLKGAEKVSIGTVMEMSWAYGTRTPVIAVMESDDIHRHLMLDETCSYIVDDLEMAVRLTESLLLPDTGR